jgi:HD superfamily phosphohydrolase
MIIDEMFYGLFELDEPLLLDLIQSDPVQRLKGVYMGGVTSLLGVGTTSTRYEHSVGAMLLVRLLGASVEEQAAALLHDVSHTALSHVIDYVFDTPSRQAFHDDVKEQ